ncbi:protein kinase domain-containing protein [Actinopolyspora halophila]|uniref:protein kinase domain-containing protein n=1 Tax=Actinopolyspora halophila TaxID=1850 RepID=UPI000A0455E3
MRCESAAKPPSRGHERGAGQAAARAGSRGEASLIHRDLEPSNVMIADSGTIKVLDFGIAVVLDGGHTKNSPVRARAWEPRPTWPRNRP